MVHILYNPSSNCGYDTKAVLSEIAENFEQSNALSLFDIEDIKAFFEALNQSDEVVLVGGDGTLNVVLNKLRGYVIKNNLYLYKGGSGNDFLRDVCSDKFESTKLLQINEYVENLPVVTVNGKEYLFINNVGFGIDGKVCTAAEDIRAKGKSKINYTTLAIKLLLTSYKPNGATVTVDGKKRKYKRVWMAPIMNGLYYGGGMMPCPNQNRKSDLISTCVIHSTNALQTLIIFPSIFKGEHVKHKSKVVEMSGKEIAVEFDKPQDVQIDGETIRNVTKISAVKYSALENSGAKTASANA